MGITTANNLKEEFIAIKDSKNSKHFKNLLSFSKDCNKLLSILQESLADNLPNNMRDGGFVAEGYSSRLDKLRALRNESRRYILDLETKEKALTNISTLKIK